MPSVKTVNVVAKAVRVNPTRVAKVARRVKLKRATPKQIAESAIKRKYDELDGLKGWLRKASTQVTQCPDKIGYFRHFQGGSIYYSPTTGAHAVKGAIRRRWSELSWERGDLGYPVTDEERGRNADGVGRYTEFQGGGIYWTLEFGAVVLQGPIWEKYKDLGAEASVLGFPRQEAKRTPGQVRRMGRFVHFENGSIYYSAQTGAWEVHGTIRGYWAERGWERNQNLGFPISDELIPDRAMGWRSPAGVSRATRVAASAAIKESAVAVGGVGSVRTNAIAAVPKLTLNPAFTGKKSVAVLKPQVLKLAPNVLEVLQAAESENRFSDFENGVVFWNRDTGKASQLSPWKKTKSGKSMQMSAAVVAAKLRGEIAKRVILPSCTLLSVAFDVTGSYRFDGAGTLNRKHRLTVRWRGQIRVGSGKYSPVDISIRINALVSWNPLHRTIDMALTSFQNRSVPRTVKSIADLPKLIGQRMDPLLWQRIKIMDIPLSDGGQRVAVLSVKTMSDGTVNVFREPTN